METVNAVNAVELFRAWLQDEEKARHISGQRWLSNELNVAQPTVYRWWAGQLKPKPEYRQAICTLSKGRVPVEAWYTPSELAVAQMGVTRAKQKTTTSR